jgi:hypothetical protein
MQDNPSWESGYSGVNMDASSIYHGSDGAATTRLYAVLEAIGPAGVVAMNLFRAQKASSRAKCYRGGMKGKGSYRSMAYDRKQWSLSNLADTLKEHAESIGVTWGWGEDPSTANYPFVLYVDLPTGQVSFHSPERGEGPDYVWDWDGVKGASEDRVVDWTQQVLDEHPDVEPVHRPVERKAPDAPLTDEDRMPWGKYKDMRLADVPLEYWEWFIEQGWSGKWKGLKKYAKHRAAGPAKERRLPIVVGAASIPESDEIPF